MCANIGQHQDHYTAQWFYKENPCWWNGFSQQRTPWAIVGCSIAEHRIFCWALDTNLCAKWLKHDINSCIARIQYYAMRSKNKKTAFDHTICCARQSSFKICWFYSVSSIQRLHAFILHQIHFKSRPFIAQ